MDYTADPNGGTSAGQNGQPFNYGPTNEHPNSHDFTQLASIYTSHLDGTSGTGGKKNRNGAGPAEQAEEALGISRSQWGDVIETDAQGRPSLYRKVIDQDRIVYTFVIYADNSPDAQGGAGNSGGGHSHGGTVDDGTGIGAVDDGGRNDGGRDGGKRDGAKKDGGDKRDGNKQRQRNHDRHNH
jgi:hypothetical protein